MVFLGFQPTAMRPSKCDWLRGLLVVLTMK